MWNIRIAITPNFVMKGIFLSYSTCLNVKNGQIQLFHEVNDDDTMSQTGM